MAEEEEVDAADEQGGGDANAVGGGGKKKLVIIVAVVLLLVIGGIAGAYFTGLLDPVIKMITGKAPGDAAQGTEGGQTGPSVFYELPALTVNLNTGGRKARFIKIQVSLELEKAEDKPIIEGVIARVMDNFNVYLRELRVEDLRLGRYVPAPRGIVGSHSRRRVPGEGPRHSVQRDADPMTMHGRPGMARD